MVQNLLYDVHSTGLLDNLNEVVVFGGLLLWIVPCIFGLLPKNVFKYMWGQT